MNELSCKTFRDIRNDFKKLDVITEQDYIFHQYNQGTMFS